jgi:hypothetical protein
LSFGREGFRNYKGVEYGEAMKLTRRFYPHVNNMVRAASSVLVPHLLTHSTGRLLRRQVQGAPVDFLLSVQCLTHYQIGKPAKTVAISDAEPIEPFTAIAENSDEETVPAPERTAFDSDEDRQLIIEGKRAALKRKGVKIHPKERSKPSKKAKA